MVRACVDQWQPLLAGAMHDAARSAVRDIADHLTKAGGTPWHPSLAEPRRLPYFATLSNGTPGMAVLFHYLSAIGERDEWVAQATRLMDQALAVVSTTRLPAGLYNGFTGSAWVLAYLNRRAPEHFAAEGLDEVDDALQRLLSIDNWRGQFDLISGLCGLAVYALERHTAAADTCLELIAGHLERTAVLDASGARWHTSASDLSPAMREHYPDGCAVIGMAHGLPGVIAVLSQIYRRGIKESTTEQLCQHAVAWMMAQRQDPPARSRYPAYVGSGRRTPSRLAWCYGDLGVASALYEAGLTLSEPTWTAEAVETAMFAATVDGADAGVVDASFCHGAAGLGHVFNRLYQQMRAPALALASTKWFERTLTLRQAEGEAPGFLHQTFNLKGEERWVPEPGFLEGTAGIALALLAATSALPPDWDAAYLLAPSATRSP